MTTATKPREVRLPVCPRCGTVGKLPGSNWSGKSICTGPPGQLHAKSRMTLTRFVEQPVEAPRAAA